MTTPEQDIADIAQKLAKLGWQAIECDICGSSARAFPQSPSVQQAAPQAPSGQQAEPTDEQLIALNAGERFFSESPTKYPEARHGTQYHAGAPGVVGFARAAIALAGQLSERPAPAGPMPRELSAEEIRVIRNSASPGVPGYTTAIIRKAFEWGLESAPAGQAVTIATDPRVAEQAVTAAREQEASATGAEPVAYRYKDVRGHWRYVGAPLSEGWALPANLSFEPLFTYRHLREYAAIARQQGRNEMREWAVEKAAKMVEQMTMRQRLMRAAGDAKPVQPCEIAAAIRSIGTPKSAEGEGA